MHLLSTSKETVLSNFSDLKVQSIHLHPNGESTDFQCYSEQNIFVEVNKKSGLEILRLKERAPNEFDIQRVRKLTINNVYCIACAKQSLEEMAVGLSNGQVKIYNYKKSEFVYKFNADNSRQSVLCLDYNSLDSHIAAAFENGQIGIYGRMSKNKMETFNVDKYSTLVRFNPVKRFHLSIASQRGTVTVYDVQDKKRVFQAVELHTAPCRDLCSSLSSPDILISVGYDCCINISDLRRNIQPIQIACYHPLSTVAMSACGNFFCVGNLKGELITYDMRQLNKNLNTAKSHNSAVDRVTFIPSDSERMSYSINSTNQNNSIMNMDNLSVASSGYLNIPTITSKKSGKVDVITCHPQRDSFCDFIESQIDSKDEKKIFCPSVRRESYDWDKLSRKPEENIKQSPLPNNSHQTPDKAAIHAVNVVNSKELPTSVVPLLSNRKLEQILEEEKLSDHTDKCLNRRSDTIQDKCGTNTLDSQSSSSRVEQMLPNDIGGELLSSSIQVCDNVQENCKTTRCSDALPTSMIEIREEMLKRIECLEFEMKFLIDSTKWEIINQSYKLWSQTLAYSQEIREDMSLLLQSDPFTMEFARLKGENIALKQEIEQLKKK